MPAAIGSHIPSQARYRNDHAQVLADIRLEAADDIASIRAAHVAHQAALIRSRAAASLQRIAAEAAVGEKYRTERRAAAARRRDEQRVARISTGTDRASLRAGRAASGPRRVVGEIRALARFFGRELTH